ncbi:MAG: oxidoreductase [Chloroflexi bacterium]|nr:oxidoreductase [Chloroflexota bacterium]
MRTGRKPKLAVWKFASCDGCQLTLLDCEDELLAIAGEVEIAYFLEASRAIVKGPYDLSVVEGSISSPEQVEAIRKVRQQSKFLVAMGACASGGGIQSLRNFADVKEYMQAVYPTPEYVRTLDKSLPMSAYVPVDLELKGCSPSKAQLLEVISAFLNGRRPNVPTHSVCVDCKRQGIACVIVALGLPCLGPVTQTGCGVLCPSHRRACYGCFGPMETPNTESLGAWFTLMGVPSDSLMRLFRTFNAYAPAFKEASERYASAEATHSHDQG